MDVRMKSELEVAEKSPEFPSRMSKQRGERNLKKEPKEPEESQKRAKKILFTQFKCLRKKWISSLLRSSPSLGTSLYFHVWLSNKTWTKKLPMSHLESFKLNIDPICSLLLLRGIAHVCSATSRFLLLTWAQTWSTNRILAPMTSEAMNRSSSWRRQN